MCLNDLLALGGGAAWLTLHKLNLQTPPLILPKELRHQVNLIRNVADKVLSEMGSSLSYKVRTMIEVPRDALVADEIAKEAEFFSFGTNDLCQQNLGV
ncbi:Pyruvate, phosphate dikinase, chloroplastic [Glycine soja]|uniref:PEP-utilising enzyme C-terminal domain-containing protein n=2 Tax=Glycine subgen. Soja TaxID=1462606 RepID=K7KX98_SOYBN|nr:Pyruvate, phosphate dikinase, chloroplastic [Glycine soja]